ncbi:hypothetical protein CLOM_g11755 [Closterium sp. NIES-68]|nr:hypothetical protein CLOM_g11755 [Closterium sp. NIES-68]GJP76549.1 hypothetical protein CLOP_g6977 [Closterium sp. NIES-67]
MDAPPSPSNASVPHFLFVSPSASYRNQPRAPPSPPSPSATASFPRFSPSRFSPSRLIDAFPLPTRPASGDCSAEEEEGGGDDYGDEGGNYGGDGAGGGGGDDGGNDGGAEEDEDAEAGEDGGEDAWRREEQNEDYRDHDEHNRADSPPLQSHRAATSSHGFSTPSPQRARSSKSPRDTSAESEDSDEYNQPSRRGDDSEPEAEAPHATGLGLGEGEEWVGLSGHGGGRVGEGGSKGGGSGGLQVPVEAALESRSLANQVLRGDEEGRLRCKLVAQQWPQDVDVFQKIDEYYYKGTLLESDARALTSPSAFQAMCRFLATSARLLPADPTPVRAGRKGPSQGQGEGGSRGGKGGRGGGRGKGLGKRGKQLGDGERSEGGQVVGGAVEAVLRLSALLSHSQPAAAAAAADARAAAVAARAGSGAACSTAAAGAAGVAVADSGSRPAGQAAAGAAEESSARASSDPWGLSTFLAGGHDRLAADVNVGGDAANEGPPAERVGGRKRRAADAFGGSWGQRAREQAGQTEGMDARWRSEDGGRAVEERERVREEEEERRREEREVVCDEAATVAWNMIGRALHASARHRGVKLPGRIQSALVEITLPPSLDNSDRRMDGEREAYHRVCSSSL